MPRSELRKNLLIAAIALCAAGAAEATEVFVTSVTPSQVHLILDGRTVRALRVGETTPEGVRLLEIRGTSAVLQVDGRTLTLGLGQATLRQATARADAKGHFIVSAVINGVPVPALIDTGATHVTLNMAQARSFGLDLRGAPRVPTHTANGTAYGYLVTLPSVQVGDIVLRNVAGKVMEGGAEALAIALVGMSFLQQVDMRRSGETLTLSRPTF